MTQRNCWKGYNGKSSAFPYTLFGLSMQQPNTRQEPATAGFWTNIPNQQYFQLFNKRQSTGNTSHLVFIFAENLRWQGSTGLRLLHHWQTTHYTKKRAKSFLNIHSSFYLSNTCIFNQKIYELLRKETDGHKWKFKKNVS